MYIHYSGNKMTVRWEIYRGVSEVREDFCRSKVVALLFNGHDRFFAPVRSEGDALEVDVAEGLPEGVYDLEAIWSKNDGRSISRSRYERAFAVTDVASESTDRGGGTSEVQLTFRSSAGTYGYDGLSAYELAVLHGKTLQSEQSWVDAAVSTAEHESARESAERARSERFEQMSEAMSASASTGIASIEQTAVSHESDGENIVTVTQLNGSQTQFTIRNGSKGEQGEKGEKGETGSSGYSGAAEDLEVVDNLISGGHAAALSAEMGKALNQKIDTSAIIHRPFFTTERITGQYVNKNGVVVSQQGQHFSYAPVGNATRFRVVWENVQNVHNYSLITFFADEGLTEVLGLLPGSQGVVSGSADIDVPEGTAYVAINYSDQRCHLYDLSSSLTADQSAAQCREEEVELLSRQYCGFTPPPLVTRLDSTYCSRSGQVVTGSAWNAYRLRVYSVTPGQEIWFQSRRWLTGFSAWCFASSYELGNHSVSLLTDDDNSEGLYRLTVPSDAKYLLVNEWSDMGDDAYDKIQCLGTPHFSNGGEVPNLNPSFSLRPVVYADLNYRVSMEERCSGIAAMFDGGVFLPYVSVEDDTEGIFSSTGADRFLEMTPQTSGAGNRFFYLVSGDFTPKFSQTKALRVSFDIHIETNGNEYATLPFRFGLYPQGSVSAVAASTRNVRVYDRTLQHVDITFGFSTLDGADWGQLHLNAASGNSAVRVVRIANLVVTDEVVNTAMHSAYGQEPLHSPAERRLSTYFGKTVLFLGDSISTGDGWWWKGYLRKRYGLWSAEAETTAEELRPASGSITICDAGTGFCRTESEAGRTKHSIWYKCAGGRMGRYAFDVISLFGGTNDGWWNYPGGLGTASDIPYVDDVLTFDNPQDYTDEWSENLTFAQFYKGCVEMLRRDFPDKEIILSTLYPQNSSQRDTDPVSGLRRDEAMSRLIVEIGKHYGLKVNPWYWLMHPASLTPWFTHDGGHPSQHLGALMAERFAKALGA